MKSDLAVAMLVLVKIENACMLTNIMNEDSTSVAKKKKSVPHEVIKENDINHAKNVRNNLYILQKKHRILSSEVISYLQKCFSNTRSSTRTIQ